jgi:sugar phosphate isomerase/epimerase
MEAIDESIELAKLYQANFEYNDFFMGDVLDNAEEVKRRIEFYKSLDRDRSKDTMHGVFLDITIHSSDSKIREISEMRIRQSLDIAMELGIRGVVFHTNFIANFRQEAYMNTWLKMNVEFWKRMLEEYPKLEIYIENMFDLYPDLLARLAEEMKEHQRFGVCLDYAHASISGYDVALWMKTLAPYIKHMHINDNDLAVDLHQEIGTGAIDWEQYNLLLKQYRINSSVLVEVSALESQKQSLKYMKEHKVYPL